MIRIELTLVSSREQDGRHIAEVPELPGALAYGRTRLEAQGRAQAVALFALGERALDGGVLLEVVRFTISERSSSSGR